MNRQGWLALILVAILVGSTGCVSCGSRGYGLALDASPDCEVPDYQRNQTYIIAISSWNPAGIVALDSLRLKLHEKGFAKVATGQTWHTPWMIAEMRRIASTNPDAVFVILGCESGAASAARLAENAIAQGLPVGALVLLDADGTTTAPRLGVRTLTIGSGYGAAATTALESVVIPDTTRIGLLTDARTVDAVTRVLNEIAMTIPMESTVVTTGWDYPHAPADRPVIAIGNHVEWSYLFDQPGARVAAIGERVAASEGSPTAPATTAVRRP